jgi:Ca2+-binding EF-hand superfamily protein
MFEDMMDELGEGIHGNELEAQKALVDPDDTDTVTRPAFISWYVKFVSSDGNDNDSLDSEDLAEREEDKNNAKEQFASLATPAEGGTLAIKKERFPELIEKLGTVYCEEEHSKTIKKLVRSNGMIYEDDFIAWYMKWLYEDESSDTEEDESDEDAPPAPSSSKGWGDIFGEQINGDTWKCDICSVPNDKRATKCVACETAKPDLAAANDTASAPPQTSTVSGSSIGAGGFSFGSTSTSGGGIPISSKGWGNIFSDQGGEDTWKCDICMVRNDKSATKCASCETPKPGLAQPDKNAVPETSTVSGSSIGAGGFSFGGTSTGASGFSFGSAPVTAAPKGEEGSKPSGFSFGGGTEAPTGGFSFGSSPVLAASTNIAKAQVGFSFGASATAPMATSTTTKDGEQKPAPTTTATKPAAAGNLPGEKKAAEVFDSFDEYKAGILPLNKFEDMMDEIGEGIHGDELEAQKALVDPEGIKKVTRDAFISWYSRLLMSADADNDSLSTEAQEEWEDEKKDAEEQFASLATPGLDGEPAIKKEQFPNLIEKFGTVYCEEEHSKTINKLVRSDGMIYEEDFIAWYMKWLFEDGSSDEEEDEKDDNEEDSTSGGGIPISSKGWGNIFSDQGGEDTWKCDICMVRNDKSATKCASCETPKPGLAQPDKNAVPETSTVSGSSIGAGGFSFGGTSTGASGFSFGSAPVTAAPKGEEGSKPSGFSFGGGTAAPTGGFSFGNSFVAPSSSEGGSTAKKSGTKSSEASKPELSTNTATTAPSSKAKLSSDYPPISVVAPSPFGAAKATATASAKSTGSLAYPPMSSKPPVPFGGDKSKATTASTTSGSAAFPPMSSKPPVPFGGDKSKATTASTTSGSAAFPPMSTKAPSPFSAGKSKESPASTTTGSAAFPPMSSKAPSPFSAVKQKESAPSSTSGSAAFPPMSSKAPSPFSAVKSKESPASTATGSPAFPPMSSKAPSPFSAVKQKESAPSSTSGSAAFPPMSSQAPSPFSAVKAKESPASTATGSAAFPPMSSKAPRPFRGSGGSLEESKPLGTSSSQAPKPFGVAFSASTSGKSAASPFSSSALKTPGASASTGTARSSASSPWKKPAASDYESQFRDVVGKFQVSISSLADSRLSPEGDSKFEREIEHLVREKDSVVMSCTDVLSKITKQKERSVFLLSRKTDVERQMSECRRQINIQEKSRSDQADVIEKQPLDAESERSRRSISVKALMVNKRLGLLEKRTSLLRGVCKIDDENSTDGDSVSLSETDRRNILFQAVTSSFQNAKSFEEGVARAHNRVVGYTESFPAFSSDLVSTPVSQSRPSSRGNLSGRKSRHRLTPVSLGPLSTKTPSSRSTDVGDKTEKWSRIEQAVRRTKSRSNVVPVKKLTRLSRIGGNTKSFSQSESISARPLGPSLLLSPTEGVPVISTTKTNQTERRITFSTPLSKLRPDWNVDSITDQEKMKGFSLAFPRHLNKIDAAEASRQALSSFGTTPEKSERAFELKKKSTSSAVLGSAKSAEVASSSRSPSAAAFPPMPTKAPTPFSAGKSSEKGSSQTNQSSAYPPVAPNAPKPFSSGTASASKPTEPKGETSKPPSLQPKTSFPSLLRSPAGEEKDTKGTPAFGDLKGLGDSLFAADSGSSPDKSESDDMGLSLGTPLSPNDSPTRDKSVADYRSILVQFYTKHNPARVDEVDKTLEKYKGREVEMFAKLAKKYNVPSPLDAAATIPAPGPSSTAFGKTAPSPFATPVAPMPSSSNTTSVFGSTAKVTGVAFGAPSPSPFGASTSQPSSSIGQSPFGKPAASPFGSSPSPFGPPGTSQASPFGQQAAPQPAATPTSKTLIGGREPREVLVAFYQKYNPSKVGDVDKNLLKYKGNEELLFRNLAKKYNLDPTIFGLSPTPPASSAPFGQPSASGGFGQTSQPFASPSTPGFGQTSTLGGGSATFGSLSPAPAFGSPSPIGGGQATFGSMAQSRTQQTTPFGGSGMQQTGGFGSLSSGSSFGGGGAFGGGAAPGGNPFGAPRR